MSETGIYKDIAERTGGNIYIGVVGPVRTGKSTFIKRFMDMLVLPNITEGYKRDRAIDELPQSSAGRTIMTTEPKMIPENGVEIMLDNNAGLKVRMVDCVGYIVPSSLGYIEGDQPRMVMTPWFDEPVPFNMAAELGTRKVITEHSTIGLVVTTDGSISDIPREEYEEAEERVITELRQINKPFVVLLNSAYPNSPETTELAESLSQKYGVSVMPVNCLELGEQDIKDILAQVLFQFPVKEIHLSLPAWFSAIGADHWLRNELYSALLCAATDIKRISDIDILESAAGRCEHVLACRTAKIEMGSGKAIMEIEMEKNLFYKVLSESTGFEIDGDQSLMNCMAELAFMKKEYMRVKNALDEVEATGYGIVMPAMEELTLEEPEIVRQGGRYGVRLKASAPSIHLMKADITTEVSPIVGSEKQSEDLVMYLLKEFEEDPTKIWDSNIFGKSLHELVNEGLRTKLSRMPGEARLRLQETLERVINEGCSGLICIIL